MLPPSAHRAQQAAVDRDGGTRRVAPARRDQRRDVVDGADPAHRDLAHELGAHGLWILGPRREHPFESLRLDVAGTYRVDVDVVTGRLERQRLGKADHTGPGRDRKAETRDRLDRRDRRDVEDAAAALADQMGQGTARHAHDGHQILLDGSGPGRVVEALQAAERRSAVVVDQDVDAAELAAHRVDDAGAVLGAAAIGLDRQNLGAGLPRDRLGGAAERGLAARRHGNARPFGGERARNAVADAHAGAADDRDLALQAEIHGVTLATRPRQGSARRSYGRPSPGPPADSLPPASRG